LVLRLLSTRPPYRSEKHLLRAPTLRRARITVSFPAEKDLFARKQGKQGKHMAATLNQQAMEHAMASRPAITDPVAPAES